MKARSILFLRIASMLDGISFVILLYFAIYEKRMLGNPEAIRIPGQIHGGLFVLLLLALLFAWKQNQWSMKRPMLVFGCAIIPFAPFFLDASLRREQARA